MRRIDPRVRADLRADLHELGASPADTAHVLEELTGLTDLVGDVPAPSPELAHLLGVATPQPGTGVGAEPAGAVAGWADRLRHGARRSGALSGALVLAVSGVGATGLSAAANSLPHSLQHRVSEFSRSYLPFHFPAPVTTSSPDDSLEDRRLWSDSAAPSRTRPDSFALGGRGDAAPVDEAADVLRAGLAAGVDARSFLAAATGSQGADQAEARGRPDGAAAPRPRTAKPLWEPTSTTASGPTRDADPAPSASTSPSATPSGSPSGSPSVVPRPVLAPVKGVAGRPTVVPVPRPSVPPPTSPAPFLPPSPAPSVSPSASPSASPSPSAGPTDPGGSPSSSTSDPADDASG